MEQNVAAPSPWWYGVAVLVVLAVGQSVTGRMFGAISGGLAMLFDGLLLGGGIGVVTFLRRRKANWQGSF